MKLFFKFWSIFRKLGFKLDFQFVFLKRHSKWMIQVFKQALNMRPQLLLLVKISWSCSLTWNKNKSRSVTKKNDSLGSTTLFKKAQKEKRGTSSTIPGFFVGLITAPCWRWSNTSAKFIIKGHSFIYLHLFSGISNKKGRWWIPSHHHPVSQGVVL